jgi:hypothetical protein
MSTSIKPLRACGFAIMFLGASAASTRAYADAAVCVANVAGKNLDVQRVNVRIDANTGRVNGGTRFPGAESVQVIIDGKNPFKYAYRIDLVSTPLAEAIAGRFFQGIPGLAGVAAGGGTPGAFTPNVVTPPPGAPGAPPPPPCNAADSALLATLTAARDTAATARTTLGATLNPQVAVFKRYEKFLGDTNVDVLPDVSATMACQEADYLSTNLATLIDLGNTPQRLEAYVKAVAAVKAANDAFAAAAQTCRDDAASAAVVADATAMIGEIATLQANVKKLQDEKASFEAMKTLTANVLADPHPFAQAYYPPGAGAATSVAVTVTRTNLRQPAPKEERTANVLLQVGESSVSVSAGLGFTTAYERRIGRVSAMVPVAATATTPATEALGNRFNYVENSRNRGIAMMMLNERIPAVLGLKGKWWPDVVSTGIGFRPDGGTTVHTEWIPAAVGWRGGSRHVLFSVGLHLSRGDCLPDPTATKDKPPCDERHDTFKIGDPIPSGLTDPLPVQRVWSRGLMFGVTFKTE